MVLHLPTGPLKIRSGLESGTQTAYPELTSPLANELATASSRLVCGGRDVPRNDKHERHMSKIVAIFRQFAGQSVITGDTRRLAAKPS